MNITQFWNKNKFALSTFACLALTIWVAHFFHFRDFGFYEDDYAYIYPANGRNMSDLLDTLAFVFLKWPQGRPIGFFLPQFFSIISSKLGGVYVVYLIAFFIITLNAFLFYNLLKRVFQESIAFIGALVFCLFPADTTHTFLMHALGLQTSITFFLIASHNYLSGKRVLPYLVILCALLTYESPFMVFLGVPLLKRKIKWDRLFRKELIHHIAIMAGIIFFVVVIRASLGEGRITEMGTSISYFVRIPAKIVANIFIGPAVSLSLFFHGPIRTLFHWNWQLSIVFVASMGFFIWVLRILTINAFDEKHDYKIAFRSRIFAYNGTIQIPSYYSGIAKLFLVGVIMLCLAYVFSFTHFPALARYGRLTSVHLASAVGGSLIFTCVCSVFLHVANAYRIKNYAIIFLALYLSLLVAYRFSIQLDFQQAWQNERSFWTSVIENSPDMTNETVIFVLDHDLPKTRYILSNSWVDPIILQHMFQFPNSWETPPRLFVVKNDWTYHLIREGDKFKWKVPILESHWEILPDSNLILLEMEHGILVRRFGSININGQEFELKSKPMDVKLNFGKKPLYNYLVDEKSYQSYKKNFHKNYEKNKYCYSSLF